MPPYHPRSAHRLHELGCPPEPTSSARCALSRAGLVRSYGGGAHAVVARRAPRRPDMDNSVGDLSCLGGGLCPTGLAMIHVPSSPSRDCVMARSSTSSGTNDACPPATVAPPRLAPGFDNDPLGDTSTAPARVPVRSGSPDSLSDGTRPHMNYQGGGTDTPVTASQGGGTKAKPQCPEDDPLRGFVRCPEVGTVGTLDVSPFLVAGAGRRGRMAAARHQVLHQRLHDRRPGNYMCKGIDKVLTFGYSSAYLGLLVLFVDGLAALVFRRRDVS